MVVYVWLSNPIFIAICKTGDCALCNKTISIQQIQRLLQDVDKRDHQLAVVKDEQNEGQKREENLRRQLDKLIYDKNSLQADLTANRVELDDAKQNINVTLRFVDFSSYCLAV